MQERKSVSNVTRCRSIYRRRAGIHRRREGKEKAGR
jgi:hypothetical protein